MPSWKTPTTEQVDQAVARLVRPEQRRYFFDKLQNPIWLVPLEERGFFSTPPPAIHDNTKGTINYPPWPAVQYLDRMAALPEAQQDVLRIALNIPDTDNVTVQEAIAELATRLPASMAAQFVPKTPQWLNQPFHALLPTHLANLIEHLAKNNEPAAAATLAKNTLAITKAAGPDVRANIDAWHYGEVLQHIVPSLTQAIGMEALTIIGDPLRAAAPPYSKAGAPTFEDGSSIWHDHIEEDHDLHGIRNFLVSATRNTAAQLAHQSPQHAKSVITALEARPTIVFHRIALDILRREQTSVPDLVTAHVTNHDLFAHNSVQHEYQGLLHDAFPSLRPADQEQILTWIHDGPTIRTQPGATPPTPDELVRYKKYCERRHLTPIAEYLTGQWKERYENIIKELGREEPEPEGAVGLTSPITREELAKKNPTELIDYLGTWTPTSDDIFQPSREGIGVDLTSIISINPALLDTVIDRARTLRPTYIRSYYSGLREAIEKGLAISWEPVLDLATWIINQPPGERKDNPFQEDNDWASTRNAIADLITCALNKATGHKKEHQIGIEHRDKIWAIIAALTTDPDPTPAFEAKHGKELDASRLAMNTTRGKAIEAVIEYALWLHYQHNATFASMPEAATVLDEHLAHDHSAAVHSIYGRFFPWLVLLDHAWAAARVTSIFSSQHGNQAWESYLTFNPAYDDAVALLDAYYDAAVKNLDPNRSKPKHGNRPDPDEHLAEHLMARYWRTQLALNDSLMEGFFNRAPAHVRAHAIEYIGRNLYAHKGSIPTAIAERLVALWAVRRAAANIVPEELTAFGWWFASGKLDAPWAFAELRSVLQAAGAIDMEHWVMERLATLAPTHLLLALDCLRLLISIGPPWHILGSEKHITTILNAGLHSEEPAARETAKDLIHDLGIRGYTKFRSLLPIQ